MMPLEDVQCTLALCPQPRGGQVAITPDARYPAGLPVSMGQAFYVALAVWGSFP